MPYIIMAVQEEGSEIRICEYDEHPRGFDTQEAAFEAMDKAMEDYPEYAAMWVEQLKDQAYWMFEHPCSDNDEDY